MKKIVCEMCGSADLIKQEGVFICQSCGVKYSVEEAKKMMVEGTVEVQGTVKIDTSEELVNWRQIARRAKENDDSETAAKYYGLISEKEPANWEAYFYSVYFEESNCRLIEMTAACDRVSKCAYTALQLIKEHIANRDEQILAVLEIAEKTVDFADTVYDTAITNYKQRSDDTMLNHCLTATVMPLKMGEAIKAVFGEYQELHNMIAAVWKDGVDLIIAMCRDSFPLDGMIKIAREHADKIKEYDTSYVTPAYLLQQSTPKTATPQTPDDIARELLNAGYQNTPLHAIKILRERTGLGLKDAKDVVDRVFASAGCGTDNPTPQKSGGCYVATCVYGSYDCPQVWTLRRYRDNTLAATWFGRLFIHTYYAISPTLVKWFGHTEWFKNMWKGKLDRMVSKLQSNGVESTPYQDKNW